MGLLNEFGMIIMKKLVVFLINLGIDLIILTKLYGKITFIKLKERTGVTISTIPHITRTARE